MHYSWQQRILEEVLGKPGGLKALAEAMRGSNEEQSKGRCVIWLAGPQWKERGEQTPDVDHPFQLVSDDIGLAFSFLPEDEPKSARPAYHPKQTEIVVALEGPVVVRTSMDAVDEDNAYPAEIILDPASKQNVLILRPGICHAVTSLNGQRGINFFIKTDMGVSPEKVECGNCEIFAGSATQAEHCWLKRWYRSYEKGAKR